MLSNRRQIVTGAALMAGGVALSASKALADSAMAPDADKTRTAIHQENVFKAAPARIYDVLLDSKEFAAVTGLHAEIGKSEGDAFSTFGGIIIGRNIELVPAQRIVQAWKPNYWPPGIYSLVKFELVAEGAGTKIVLDHWGFPEGTYAGLNSGWPERYWHPLEKYLG